MTNNNQSFSVEWFTYVYMKDKWHLRKPFSRQICLLCVKLFGRYVTHHQTQENTVSSELCAHSSIVFECKERNDSRLFCVLDLGGGKGIRWNPYVLEWGRGRRRGYKVESLCFGMRQREEEGFRAVEVSLCCVWGWCGGGREDDVLVSRDLGW